MRSASPGVDRRQYQQNQWLPSCRRRSSSMLPTLRSASSHLRATSSRESSFPARARHIFSATSLHASSAVSRSAPISLSRKSSSPLTRPQSSSRPTRHSLRNSFILPPCSNTPAMIGRTSISVLGGRQALALMFLAESAARIAEVGLRRRMLELGLGGSSGSSSAVSLSPRLDLRRLVRSPDSRLLFFLLSSIFLMRCCTSALRSLSSIILLYLALLVKPPPITSKPPSPSPSHIILPLFEDLKGQCGTFSGFQ